MSNIIIFLIICTVVLVTWVIRKAERQKTIVIIIMEMALVASLSFNLLLYEDNKEITCTVITEEQGIQSFSIPDTEVEVFEPVTTPTPSPEPEKEDIKIEPRYEFTDDDIYLMARLLCGSKYKDGDGEYDFDYGNEDRLDQINVVLSVVMNRVQDDRFPDTVEEVIMQRYHGQDYQFSAVSLWKSDNGEVSDIAITRVTDWCYAYNNRLKGVQAVPEDYVYFSANGRGINVARRDL